MPGIVKKKYLDETRHLQMSFTRALNLISEALPSVYDKYILLEMFKELFPIEWGNLNQRFELYESKDRFLSEVGKKKKYYHDEPDVFFFKLQKVKHMISGVQKAKHKQNHDSNKSNNAYEKLLIKAKKQKANHASKLVKVNRDLQVVEPLYIDAFISAYHQRGISTKEKIEIFREIKKYNSKKVIEFFYKLNDSERNNQIRMMAFEYIQKLGIAVRLRKKFKGKDKSYNIETDDFIVSPIDLYQRMESDTVQNKKSFHVFISHSYLDSNLVRQLKSCLNSHGLTVYCDWTSDNDFLKRDLVSEYTGMVLKKRIEQSKAIIFLETENSISKDGSLISPWVKMEIDHAISIAKPIFYLNFSHNNSPFQLIAHKLENEILEIDAIELEKIRS